MRTGMKTADCAIGRQDCGVGPTGTVLGFGRKATDRQGGDKTGRPAGESCPWVGFAQERRRNARMTPRTTAPGLRTRFRGTALRWVARGGRFAHVGGVVRPAPFILLRCSSSPTLMFQGTLVRLVRPPGAFMAGTVVRRRGTGPLVPSYARHQPWICASLASHAFQDFLAEELDAYPRSTRRGSSGRRSCSDCRSGRTEAVDRGVRWLARTRLRTLGSRARSCTLGVVFSWTSACSLPVRRGAGSLYCVLDSIAYVPRLPGRGRVFETYLLRT
ncbi:hypothetical protein B0H10DRAFT_734219 [Mycena sp. CBHHK59/15]|nr:hypothetical protein B0H10DRAFT_734219 [Mycena sp. CBHHK59/15]